MAFHTNSKGLASPRKEILHNIDPLSVHKSLKPYPHQFNTQTLAALRVGDWKLITGNPGELVVSHREHLCPKIHTMVQQTVNWLYL